jgi:arginyl-tRNA synthetase
MLLVQKQLIEALQNGLSSLFQIQAIDLVLQETKKEFEGSYTFVVFPFTKQAGLAPAAIAEKLGQFVIENYSGVKKFQVVQGFLNFSFTALIPHPISTPTAAGIIAPWVAITLPTVAPIPQ